MRNKLLSFAILSALLFLSCVDKEKHEVGYVVTIGKETSVNLSDFTTGIQIVKLENSDSSVLSYIQKIEIEDSLLYVMDDIFKGISIYSLEGKLTKKFTKVGKGPGEYLSINDFIVDQNNNRLEVFDRQLMRIYVYRLDNFDFVKKIDIPLSFCYKFAKKDNIYYFQTNEARNFLSDGKSTNSEVIAFDSNSGKITALFDRQKAESENQHWEFFEIFCVDKISQKIYISLAWDKYHYKLENDKAIPVFQIDAETRGISGRMYAGNYDERMAYINNSGIMNKAHFFKLIMNNYIGMIIDYGIGFPPKDCYYFNLKKTNQIFYTNNIINDYLPYPIENTPIFKVDNGVLVSVFYPFMDNVDASLYSYLDINDNDNPIIFLFKLN